MRMKSAFNGTKTNGRNKETTERSKLLILKKCSVSLHKLFPLMMGPVYMSKKCNDETSTRSTNETLWVPVYSGTQKIGYQPTSSHRRSFETKLNESDNKTASKISYGVVNLEPTVILQRSNDRGKRKLVDLKILKDPLKVTSGTVDINCVPDIKKPDFVPIQPSGTKRVGKFAEERQNNNNAISEVTDLQLRANKAKLVETKLERKNVPTRSSHPAKVDIKIHNGAFTDLEQYSSTIQLRSTSELKSSLTMALQNMRSHQRKRKLETEKAETEEISNLKTTEIISSAESNHVVTPRSDCPNQSNHDLPENTKKPSELSLSKDANFSTKVKNKFCNICGKGNLSRRDLSSFLQLAENRIRRFVCLTCHQRCAPSERPTHKADCFLSHDEVYYDKWEEDLPENVEKRFRMLVCRHCSDCIKKLDCD